MSPAAPQPAADCPICPRLVEFRETQRRLHPDWHNAPVPSFGPPDARVLIVGLAPGLRGANRTGRPFTGDHAGDLLYRTLLECGLATGSYERDPQDSLRLVDCRIVNAVRCVPPANKPLPREIAACRQFLIGEMTAATQVRVIVALGRIAHDSVLTTVGQRPSAWPFAHGAVHALPDGPILVDSYHCSRQNTNTGRLTPPMFRAVFDTAIALLDGLGAATSRRERPAGASPSE